jgi:hypothetical protein
MNNGTSSVRVSMETKDTLMKAAVNFSQSEKTPEQREATDELGMTFGNGVELKAYFDSPDTLTAIKDVLGNFVMPFLGQQVRSDKPCGGCSEEETEAGVHKFVHRFSTDIPNFNVEYFKAFMEASAALYVEKMKEMSEEETPQ